MLCMFIALVIILYEALDCIIIAYVLFILFWRKYFVFIEESTIKSTHFYDIYADI